MSDWAAGWYEDPEFDGQIRYWDGDGWTSIRHATPKNFPLGRPGPDASGKGARVDQVGAAEPSERPGPERPEARREHEARGSIQPDRPREGSHPRPKPRDERPDVGTQEQRSRPGPPGRGDGVSERTKSRFPLAIGLGIGGLLVAAVLIGAFVVLRGPLGQPHPGSTLAEPAEGAAASEWGKTYSGDGDHALRIPAGGNAGLVRVKYRGDTNFTIHSVDDDGERTGLLFNSIGWTSGTAAYDLGSRGPSAWLSITTEGRWSVTFEKLSTAPEFGKSETGSRTKVFGWNGQASQVAVTYTPTGRASLFTLMAYGSQEHGDQLTVEGEKFKGAVEVPAGTEYLVVETDGDWELTRK